MTKTPDAPLMFLDMLRLARAKAIEVHGPRWDLVPGATMWVRMPKELALKARAGKWIGGYHDVRRLGAGWTGPKPTTAVKSRSPCSNSGPWGSTTRAPAWSGSDPVSNCKKVRDTLRTGRADGRRMPPCNRRRPIGHDGALATK